MNSLDLIRQSFNEFYVAAIDRIPQALLALVVVLVALAVRSIVHNWAHVRVTHATRRKVLAARIAETVVLVVGGITALTVLGVNLGALLAGLGLVTVGLSFALQDIVVNYVAGLQLLSNAPFELGDEITIADVQGTVKTIGSRTTTLALFDGRTVSVPNRDMLTKPVTVDVKPRRATPRR